MKKRLNLTSITSQTELNRIAKSGMADLRQFRNAIAYCKRLGKLEQCKRLHQARVLLKTAQFNSQLSELVGNIVKASKQQ